MEEFKDLKGLVKKLRDQKDNREKVVEVLQEIGKYILQNCFFDFGDGREIYPLWIEAYYYDKDYFPDEFCHNKEDQRDRFGLPYPHHKKDGIDICFSQEKDYCLSYLIKVSYDQDKSIYSQKELYQELSGSIDNWKNKMVLRFSNDINDREVDNYYRIGLDCNHDMKKLFFQESLLSSYFDLCFDLLEDNNDIIGGIIKQTLTREYKEKDNDKKKKDNLTLKKEDFVINYLKRRPDRIESYMQNNKDEEDREIVRNQAIKLISKQIIGYELGTTIFDGKRFKDEVLPLLYEDIVVYQRL